MEGRGRLRDLVNIFEVSLELLLWLGLVCVVSRSRLVFGFGETRIDCGYDFWSLDDCGIGSERRCLY